MSTEDPNDENQQSSPGTTPDDEAREFVQRLRSAPAEDILADVFSTLLSAAQVKLGRRDARLFIDLCAQTLQYAGPHVSDQLSKQVDMALGQLRLAQVGAENEAAKKDEASTPSDAG